MLEEALNDVNRSPGETSRALLSFFRHEFPVGGTAAEARFIQFFPVLLDRILGPVLVHSLKSSSGNDINNKDGRGLKPEELQAMEAAWLLYYRAWRSSNNSSGSNRGGIMSSSSSIGSKSGTGMGTSAARSGHMGASSMSSLDHDPVVQLLGAKLQASSTSTSTSRALSFFQILHGDNEAMEQLVISRTAQMSFPFTELPRHLQEAMVKIVYRTMVERSHAHPGSPRPVSMQSTLQPQRNAQKLLNVMSIPFFDQKEPRQSISQIISQVHDGIETTTTQFHSPLGSMGMGVGSPRFGGASPSLVTQSTSGGGAVGAVGAGNGGGTENVSSLEQRARVQVSLWEYYMMTFVRFPFVMSKMSRSGGASSSSSGGYRPSRSSASGHGEKVYFHLLKGYIQFYFPHLFQSSTPTFNEVTDADMSDKVMTGNMSRKNREEFFMRLMMEYWLEKNTYPATDEAIANLSSNSDVGTPSNGINNTNNQQSLGLDSSYDLAQLLSMPMNVWHALPKTEDHGHGHGHHHHHHEQPRIQLVRATYSPTSKSVRKCVSMLVGHLISDPAIARQCRRATTKQATSTTSISSLSSWPLPSSQTILQPTLYNHIRVGLRYVSVHVNNSSFYAALDLWLLWLEPWNVLQRK